MACIKDSISSLLAQLVREAIGHGLNVPCKSRDSKAPGEVCRELLSANWSMEHKILFMNLFFLLWSPLENCTSQLISDEQYHLGENNYRNAWCRFFLALILICNGCNLVRFFFEFTKTVMVIHCLTDYFFGELQIFFRCGREREGGGRKRVGNIPCNSLASSENLPCATSHSNASKLDAVFIVQCFYRREANLFSTECCLVHFVRDIVLV